MGMTLWKGGKQLPITQQQNRELKESGVSDMVVHGNVDLEFKIRSLLAMQGMELNYERTGKERRNQYPKPRNLDKKLKETITPFCWFSDTGRFSFFLTVFHSFTEPCLFCIMNLSAKFSDFK